MFYSQYHPYWQVSLFLNDQTCRLTDQNNDQQGKQILKRIALSTVCLSDQSGERPL